MDLFEPRCTREIVEAQMVRDMLEDQLKNLKREAAKIKTSEADRHALTQRAIELAEMLANTEVPASPRLLCDDVTSEALASLLAENEGLMALFSTEGGIFEIMAGKYNEGHLSIDVYLKGFSGDPLRVDRKGRPPEFVARPRLTLCLCVQPEVIRNLSSRPGFRGRGLLSRPLYSIPESRVGYRKQDPAPMSAQTRNAYHERIKYIGYLQNDSADDPHLIQVTPEARALLSGYQAELEPQLRPGGDLRDIRDWVLKLPGSVARIAGILHVLQNAEPDRPQPWKIPIGQQTMEAAISLGRYFTAHALAAFGLMGMSGALGVAIDLWQVIERREFTRFSRRDLHQAIRHRYSVAEVDAGLRALEEMEYIRQVLLSPPRESGGRPGSPTFEVNPLAPSTSARGFESSEGFEGTHEKQKGEDQEVAPHPVNVSEDEQTESSAETAPSPGESTDEGEILSATPTCDDTEKPVESDSTAYPQNPQNWRVGEIHYVTDVEAVHLALVELRNERVIGLDIETTGLDPAVEKVRTVQLASEKGIWVIDAWQVPIHELAEVLSGGPLKLMHNAKFDAAFLWESSAHIMPEPIFDTMLAAQVIDGGAHSKEKGYFTLTAVCERYLGFTLDKTEQTSNWSGELSPQQIQYAAQDAAILLPLYQKLMEAAQ